MTQRSSSSSFTPVFATSHSAAAWAAAPCARSAMEPLGAPFLFARWPRWQGHAHQRRPEQHPGPANASASLEVGAAELAVTHAAFRRDALRAPPGRREAPVASDATSPRTTPPPRAICNPGPGDISGTLQVTPIPTCHAPKIYVLRAARAAHATALDPARGPGPGPHRPWTEALQVTARALCARLPRNNVPRVTP